MGKILVLCIQHGNCMTTSVDHRVIFSHFQRISEFENLRSFDKCLYCKHSLEIDDVKLVDAEILVDEPSTGLLQQTLKPA